MPYEIQWWNEEEEATNDDNVAGASLVGIRLIVFSLAVPYIKDIDHADPGGSRRLVMLAGKGFRSMRLKMLGTITVGLLVVFILYYYFGLLERYNLVMAYWDSWTDTEKIVVIGELNQHDVIKSKIAPKYGFEYEVAGGCLVTQPLLNGLEDYNAIMGEKINDKLRNDWQDVLKDEISKQ